MSAVIEAKKPMDTVQLGGTICFATGHRFRVEYLVRIACGVVWRLDACHSLERLFLSSTHLVSDHYMIDVP